MKKLRFLLLDAGIIIKLFELNIWNQLVERCEITVTETVMDEAHFVPGDDGPVPIDLSSYVATKAITEVSMTSPDVAKFCDQFKPDYFEQIDPGEAESLAYLVNSNDPCWLCSADAIVFKILGRMNRAEQGISLEEILQQTGLSVALEWPYQRAFREKYTRDGQKDMIRNVGLK